MWYELLTILAFVSIVAILWKYKERVEPRLLVALSIISLLISSIAIGLGFVLAASLSSISSYFLVLLGLFVFIVRRNDHSKNIDSLMAKVDLELTWIANNVDSSILISSSIIFVVLSSIAMILRFVSLASIMAMLAYYALLAVILIFGTEAVMSRIIKIDQEG